MKLSMRHELPGTPETFWSAFFDQGLITSMYTEALGATSAEIREQTGDLATGIHRVLHAEQPIDAPGPIKRVMGDTAGTTETGTYDPSTGIFTFAMTNSTMGNRLELRGTLRCDPGENGTCLRLFDLEAKVKILGIGKVFEGFIEGQTKEAQDKSAEFWRAHLAQ